MYATTAPLRKGALRPRCYHDDDDDDDDDDDIIQSCKHTGS